MISKEQFATVSEVFATASIVGVGWALGGTVGAAIMAGIGINLGSDIIQKGSTHLKEKWISAKYGVLNHDIQRALARAFVKALASLEARYFELPEANAQPTEKKEAIRGLFKELKDETPTVFAGSIQKIVSGQEVKEYLYGEPEVSRARLWERVEGTKLLYTYYGEHFKQFLRDNINDELVFLFGEELKTDNRECNKAWRAFQRMLLEGLQADVKAVRANQEMIRQDLQVLDRIKAQLDELKDTIDRRVVGEPFQYGLEQALRSMGALLANVAGTTERTENKVDVLVGVTQRTENKIDTVVAALSAKPEAKTKNPSQVPDTHSALSLDLDLPPSLHGFIGRSMELAELESLLEKHSAVNVEGLSGIGKTSLTLSLADGWLRSGRLGPNGLFYFDCSQRNMHLGVASEFLLRNLAAFFSQAGESEVANIVANEQEPLDHRYNAVSSALMRGSFLVFLDNLQDALDKNRRIASQPLSDLLNFMLSRPLADSRFICASYVQCSWSSRLSIQPFRLKPLSTNDARALLQSLGIEDLELADRAAQLVGRHPQAIRWFSVLPRELGLSVEEVINDLSDAIDHDPTGIEFHRRIEDELLRRIWETLSDEVGHFLSVSSVYRRPVPFNALSALTPSTEVDRWRQMLLDRFLLDATTREGPHSSHQIVREFALERMQSGSDEWQDAHRAAATWWQGRAAIANYSTREGLEAGIEAHYHLTSAGDVEEALALAVRLRRGLRTAGWQSHRQGLRDESMAIHRAQVGMSPNDPRAHRYLAITLSQRGKKFRKEAESHFRRAVELSPNIGAARVGYAQLLAHDGRNEDAEKQFQEGISRNPQDGRSYVAYALFLEKNKRIEGAEAQYQNGILLNPEDAELHNGYASFLKNRGRLGEAESHFQLAVKLQPENGSIVRRYAAFLIDQNRFHEAEEHLREALDIDPNNLHLRKSYIKYLFGNKRIEEAGIQLKALSMMSPSNPRYRIAYFRILERYALREQVDSEFKAALSAEPKNGRLRGLYIKFLFKQNRVDEAEQQFRIGINANPNRASLHSSYASFLAKRGRPEEAEAQFQTAISSEPDNVGVRGSYIRFLAMRRRFDEADTQLQVVAHLKPIPTTLTHFVRLVETERMTLATNVGESPAEESSTFHRSNMWNLELPVSKRIATCKAILREDQDDFQANYCLGRTILQQLKDAPSAEPYLRRATDLKPKARPARFYYGQVLEKLGRFAEALDELNKVVGFVSTNSELHNSRANCLKQLGRLPEAEAAYRLAISDSKGRYTAKYLNNLALLFVAWPDTSRIMEGIQLCQRIKQENPTFPWTDGTLSALEERKNVPPSSL